MVADSTVPEEPAIEAEEQPTQYELPTADITTPPVDTWQPDQSSEESTSVLWLFLYSMGILLALFILLLLIIKIISVWNTKRNFKRWQFNLLSHPPVVVGFFHPYCNAGGGGERVLWQSIRALQSRYSFIRCVVYTGDKNVNKEAILKRVKTRFGIDLVQGVEFVFLKWRGCVEAETWPRFTLLGQSIGSFFLGLEAFVKCVPDVYIDSMGYAFTMPLFRWLGRCKTASYVHYPTISDDMLQVVQGRENTFNNARWISRSKFLTRCKLWYYRLFAKLYGFMGRRSNVVMVNSTWTHRHISKLWHCRPLFIVYPPCDTSTFQALPVARPKSFTIISVGQFRPEKNHELQLEVLKEFLSYIDPERRKTVKLVLVGSCRDSEDEQRVSELRSKARSLGIEKYVTFKTNLPFKGLQDEMKNAKVALHTMRNEHFGIVLPECMAAGCVMVAHNSGGPRDDIVVDYQGTRVGYLAENKENMASCLVEVLNLSDMDRRTIVQAARASVNAKFSVSVFEASFLRATEDLFG